MMKLDLIIAPALLDMYELGGWLCAVVDVLRATSSITVAVASGASAIRPCLSIAEAREGATRDRGNSLLGGEERGELIPGFDFGNSPLEYLDRSRIQGKTIFFYTTNGTGAIRRSFERTGRPVYIVSLLNLSSACTHVVKTGRETAQGIAFLCSGRYGKPSREDLFCAGLAMHQINEGLLKSGITAELSDSATIALEFASNLELDAYQVLASSEHGRYIESLGFAKDLEFASKMNLFDTVPLFDGEMIMAAS